MSTEQIDNKIKEFEILLQTKQIIRVGGKTKKRNISIHLKNFYRDEINKLKKIKESIYFSENQTLNFNWEDVIFEDFKIRISTPNIIFGPFNLIDSRKSFEHLKPYFKKLNLNPLICIINKNQIIDILNFHEIYSIIKIFTFKSLIIEFSKHQVIDLIKEIEKLDNTITISTTDLSNKSFYLKHLVSLHNLNYKIIPIFENSDSLDDSFIFCIENESKLHLIWESCSEKKATYVFSTNSENYIDKLFTVIKFIISTETNRMDLRETFINNVNYNISCNLIYHNSFNDWTYKLNSITNIN